MPTDTGQTKIVTDGQAKRLGRELGFERFTKTGQIATADIYITRILTPPPDCRDQHGWLADLRALRDYFFTNGPRPAVQEWSDVREDATVVAWAYGRSS